jgi:hypothetical protein
MKIILAMSSASVVFALSILAAFPAFAQAGGPNVTVPTVNDSARTSTDAVKKNAEMERKRLDDEAKKKDEAAKKAATGK